MIGHVYSLLGYHPGGINGRSEIHAMGVWIYLSEIFKINLKAFWNLDFPMAGNVQVVGHVVIVAFLT
jgi:hypothetical protein